MNGDSSTKPEPPAAQAGVRKTTKALPLVYSCSGCSSAAQMANHIALQLDRRQHAEMSCIAGVGGDVPSLVKVAKSGRDMLVIDGCPLDCALKSLQRHGIEPTRHLRLSAQGVRKRYHADFDLQEAGEVLEVAIGMLQKPSGAVAGEPAVQAAAAEEEAGEKDAEEISPPARRRAG